MTRTVKLNELDAVLAEYDYPVSRDTAASAGEAVTLQLADGEVNLGETIRTSDAEAFASADELASEVMSLLPRNAVGEPYQSEGEG